MQDLLYKVALGLVPKIGAVTAKQLVLHYGSAAAVFQSKAKELLHVPGIGPQMVANIQNPDVLKRAERECNLLDKHGIQVISFQDPAYPNKLLQVRDSPALLFVKGNIELNHPRIVGIVGTRKPTPQGLLHCASLIKGMADYQPVIISGLAYGIDICAHQEALQANLPTWAIMAHGHQYVYPASHRTIAHQIYEEGGALISEYAFSTRAEKEFFPMRNRIVAGLCDALIVVETAKRGGSMITAQLANQYNKDVFAIPGRLQDAHSKGCNHLIKSHQAALIEHAEDLAYVLRWESSGPGQGIQQELFVELPQEEKNIVDLLRNYPNLGIDQMALYLSTSSSFLSSRLLTLEFKGIVKSLPGSRYSLLI